MCIFTCLRILFLVASSNDEPRKVHNEVLHNNYYYNEIKRLASLANPQNYEWINNYLLYTNQL